MMLSNYCYDKLYLELRGDLIEIEVCNSVKELYSSVEGRKRLNSILNMSYSNVNKVYREYTGSIYCIGDFNDRKKRFIERMILIEDSGKFRVV